MKSWKKHGSDADMEETLEPFAKLCGECPKRLAEEIRAWSPAMEKRLEDDLFLSRLQAWEAEADEREKERPGGALHGALYTVRGLTPGTGALESRFFKGRQSSHSRHMSEEQVNDRMRIYMNGPDALDFCPQKVKDSIPRYFPSVLCQNAKARYRKFFGAKELRGREWKVRRQCKRDGGDEAAIPPRRDKGLKKGLKVGHLAHHLMLKMKQTKSTRKKENASSMDKLLVEKLKESKMKGNRDQKHKRKHHAEQEEKKKRFIERMLMPVAGPELHKKHDEEVAKHAKRHEERSQVSLVSLERNAKQQKWFAAEDCKVFCASQAEDGSDSTGRLTVVSKSMQTFCNNAPEKKKLWQVNTLEPFLQGSDWQDYIVKNGLLLEEDVSWLGAVLFGGYLVDKSWAEKSRLLREKDLVLEPLWRVRGSAVTQHLEVCFQASVYPAGSSMSPTMRAVLEAKPDRVWQAEVRKADTPSKVIQCPESSHWVWRQRRDEVRSKCAWVVCSESHEVEKLERKKEEKEKRVCELEEEIKKLEGGKAATGKTLDAALKRLGKKREELKEQRDKLKSLKGQPVTLKKFLEEVVLPHCTLCPP